MPQTAYIRVYVLFELVIEDTIYLIYLYIHTGKILHTMDKKGEIKIVNTNDT